MSDTSSAEIAPFRAIAISRLAHALQAEGRPVIHMEFGQPSTGAPSASIAIAHRVLDTDPLGYWESVALKQRLAQHYAETYGVTADPEQFVITCGASPALVLALSSRFAAGDRIALARPGYVAYRNTLRALHLVPEELECGPAERFQLSAARLAALDPAPQGVIIASPANPTGTIIPKEELRAIAEVCRARKIQIVSDEIYHGLSYVGPAHSMLEFDPSAIVINSFSKYFSMVGWRIGWMLAPKEHLHRARAFVGNLFLTAPSLSQHAALAALDSREELDGHVATYTRNRSLFLDALPALGLQKIAPPDGAFYIYADVSRYTKDSFDFCKTMLRAIDVASAPGVDFDPVEGHRFIRFSFAVSTDRLATALERLAAWLPKPR
jgi:aspartate/methionine/tyrosine aminotransferase